MMNTIPPTERDLHAGVVEYLKLVLLPGAVLHHSPNEGKRGWKAQRDIKSHGTKAGWPDLEILHHGKTYFVELKSSKGRLTPRQKLCHEQLQQAGFHVETCRSLDEVLTCCQKWGLIDAA
tara:strand:+ start:1139 stop:1498 length:360 start_codon:yes stop_codon:yes gene_type:complete